MQLKNTALLANSRPLAPLLALEKMCRLGRGPLFEQNTIATVAAAHEIVALQQDIIAAL